MRRVLLFLSAFALLALPAAAAEAPLPWLDEPAAALVDCGRTSLDLAIFGPVTPAEPIPYEPVGGGPVNTSNPNCICPHPGGAGWVMLDDTCVYHPRTALCSGECFWNNDERMIGTTTPCGSP